jgi:beta-galactosidase
MEERVEATRARVAPTGSRLYRRLATGGRAFAKGCWNWFVRSQVENLRYSRLKTCATVWLLTAALVVSASDRLTLNFNPGWKFLKADPAGAQRPEFNDTDWAVVSAPHTFNDTDTFSHWSPPGHIGETNQWSGRTWYRKSFTLPEAFKGRQVFLEFEAVRQVAEVYLNGQPLGTNSTGFIPFGFDLTPRLKFGGATNVLAVMADNRFTLEIELTRIAATELPWNSPHWHPAHGGIYRNVYLHVTDPLHITLPLYSFLQTAGPYVYATDVSEKTATVHCELPVQNSRRESETVAAQVEILDRDGKSVLRLQQTNAVAAGGAETLIFSGPVAAPQLWEPGYPYLYQAVCTLSARGKTVDSCALPLGIRTARWDTKAGFSINGHHLKLTGWGQRPTSEWPGLGAAQPDWMHYYTLALMQEAGGNFVRWGHCAGAPADIAAADQLGLLVLQPGVDGEGDAQGAAWTLRAAAFRDMLVYYRNHPSIVIWEGGNQKVAKAHAVELRASVDRFDPQGGRAFAHRRADEVTGQFMDVDIGTEGGRQVPRLPVVEGEYDREESPRRVWDNFSPPNFGYPEAKGETYQLTSEQYAVNQIGQFVTKLGAAFHCGGANWIFSDSTSGGRVGCEVARASGEVDGMRLPKEAYYVCRTLFRQDPQVHLIGHWTYPPGTKKTVYVASNGEEVELSLNGKSLGHAAPTERYLFTFPGVAWAPGELKAVATSGGKVVAVHSLHTAGSPVALRLTPILGPRGLQADGSDIALVDVEAVDEAGARCPTVQQRVDFDLAGPGVWRGGYNSGRTNSVNQPFLDLECGINRVGIRSTLVAGPLTLRARSGQLRSATLTLASQAVAMKDGCLAQLPPLPAPGPLARPVWREARSDAPAGPKTLCGRFLRAFSYSGPAAVAVQEGAKDGAKIYADREYVFAALPDPLAGSDWIQTANADKLYSAEDLMDLAVNVDGVVYIAHDGRLPCPGWLEQQFKPTECRLAVNGQAMRVFERRVRTGESLTLGSNAPARGPKACNMYIVFVKRQG